MSLEGREGGREGKEGKMKEGGWEREGELLYILKYNTMAPQY